MPSGSKGLMASPCVFQESNGIYPGISRKRENNYPNIFIFILIYVFYFDICGIEIDIVSSNRCKIKHGI